MATSTCESGNGWQSGIKSDVRLAATMPARRAVSSGSPFFSWPPRTARSAAGDTVIKPRATASRVVSALSPTSTIRMRPFGSTWDNRRLFLLVILFPLGPGSFLGQIERQAFQGHSEVDALQLHVVGGSK